MITAIAEISSAKGLQQGKNMFFFFPLRNGKGIIGVQAVIMQAEMRPVHYG